jgi:hypothetical protein
MMNLWSDAAHGFALVAKTWFFDPGVNSTTMQTICSRDLNEIVVLLVPKRTNLVPLSKKHYKVS